MKISNVCFTPTSSASSAVLKRNDFFSGTGFQVIFLLAPTESPCILFHIHKIYSLDYHLQEKEHVALSYLGRGGTKKFSAVSKSCFK